MFLPNGIQECTLKIMPQLSKLYPNYATLVVQHLKINLCNLQYQHIKIMK